MARSGLPRNTHVLTGSAHIRVGGGRCGAHSVPGVHPQHTVRGLAKPLELTVVVDRSIPAEAAARAAAARGGDIAAEGAAGLARIRYPL